MKGNGLGVVPLPPPSVLIPERLMFCKALVFGGLGLGLLMALSQESFGQGKDKKKAKDDDNKANVQEYLQIQKAKELEGKVGSVDAGRSTLFFQLDIPTLEPNPNFNPGKAANQQAQQLQNLYQQQAKILRTANPVIRQQRMRQLLTQMQKIQANAGKNGPYKVVHTFKEFDLPLVDKVVVRKLNLGIEYDNEGNILQRTKEEIAKLKGNDLRVPGFAAKLDDLKPGQVVHLYLNPAKVDKNADPDEGVGNIARPTVRMIVILQEASKSVGPTDRKKKN